MILDCNITKCEKKVKGSEYFDFKNKRGKQQEKENI